MLSALVFLSFRLSPPSTSGNEQHSLLFSLSLSHALALLIAAASVARALRFVIEALVHAVSVSALASLEFTNSNALLTAGQ